LTVASTAVTLLLVGTSVLAWVRDGSPKGGDASWRLRSRQPGPGLQGDPQACAVSRAINRRKRKLALWWEREFCKRNHLNSILGGIPADIGIIRVDAFRTFDLGNCDDLAIKF
jgi:hypothetical protein